MDTAAAYAQEITTAAVSADDEGNGMKVSQNILFHLVPLPQERFLTEANSAAAPREALLAALVHVCVEALAQGPVCLHKALQ